LSTKITFNSKEYDSPEAMPPEVRQEYERAMEILKTGNVGGFNPHVNIKLSTSVRFVHDGKVYGSLEEMPPEIRQKYEIAMQEIDMNKNGVPDFLEGDAATSKMDSESASPDPFFTENSAPIAPISAQPPVITPDEHSNTRLVMGAGLIIIFLLLVVFVLLLYIYQH
jgi:hypothetical protein